jgi:hypothetical protein
MAGAAFLLSFSRVCAFGNTSRSPSSYAFAFAAVATLSYEQSQEHAVVQTLLDS